MPVAPEGGSAPSETAAGDGRLSSARLYCETCASETPHRVFRLRRPPGGGSGAVGGVARCRVCRTTHPFESALEPTTELAVVLSDGPTSERRTVRLAPATEVEVDRPLPGFEPRSRVRRMDARDGTHPRVARAAEVDTVWASRDVGAVVKVSVVNGPTTRTTRWTTDPRTVAEVGRTVTVEGRPLTVSALRARGHTWRRFGDRFEAGEIERLYARRSERPPAGNNRWSSDRSMPRAATSSASRVRRSRSSPGVRRKRTVP